MRQPRPIVITACAAASCAGMGAAALGPSKTERPPTVFGPPAEDRGVLPPFEEEISEWIHVTRTEDHLTRQMLAAVARDLRPALRLLDADDLGTILGNTSGHVEAYETFFRTALDSGVHRVNPTMLPATLLSTQATQLNNALGVSGQATTLSGADASGLDTLGFARDRLRTEAEQALIVGGLQRLVGAARRLLADEGSSSATGIIRPSAADRDGTVLSEGVGLLLVQPLGPGCVGRPMARIAGYAAARCVSPTLADRIDEAVGGALDDAGVGASDIDVVYAAANGTSLDEVESAVLARRLGTRVENRIVAVKQWIGECRVAAGPLQAISAAQRLAESDTDTALVLCVGLDLSATALLLTKADST